MGGLCRNCEDAFGEWLTAKRTDTGKSVHLFECPDCGHRWVYSYGW